MDSTQFMFAVLVSVNVFFAVNLSLEAGQPTMIAFNTTAAVFSFYIGLSLMLQS